MSNSLEARTIEYGASAKHTLRVLGIVLLTSITCLAIWFLRRPGQLIHPYIWAEEYQILNRYQTQGLISAAIHPYQGYFLWPTSISVSLAAASGFSHLPIVDYWLSTSWFLGTVLLILLPHSTAPLRWRTLLALLLVLTPMDPEVFGILLYTLWWTTLWPLISLLWSKDYWILRIAALVAGGMSSLAGALFVFPHAVSYLITRRRRDLVGTFVLLLCLIPQVASYLISSRATAPVQPEAVAIQTLRNFSFYEFTWIPHLGSPVLAWSGAAVAVLVLAMVVHLVWGQHTMFRRELIVLLISLALMGVASSVPAPLIAHPIYAGPRYYFLPFATTSWLLVLVLMASQSRRKRAAMTILLALSLIGLTRGFARQSERVDWASQLAKCETEGAPFSIPVHSTGRRTEMWTDRLLITSASCRRMGYP